jgi:hypothetical protein
MDQATMNDSKTPSGETFVWDHPVEHLEPETAPADLVRDARMMAIVLLNDFGSELVHTAMRPGATLQEVKVKLFGISYAMGLNCSGDLSMTERADQLGVVRATLSKVARAWNCAHDLPPSWHQKSAVAITSYAATRRRVVASSNGNGAEHP